jgi:hypothetical protein
LLKGTSLASFTPSFWRSQNLGICLVLLKGTASEPVLSAVEWMPKSALFYPLFCLDCEAIKAEQKQIIFATH